MSTPSALSQAKLEKEVAFLKGVLKLLVPQVLTLGFPFEIDGKKYARHEIVARLER